MAFILFYVVNTYAQQPYYDFPHPSSPGTYSVGNVNVAFNYNSNGGNVYIDESCPSVLGYNSTDGGFFNFGFNVPIAGVKIRGIRQTFNFDTTITIKINGAPYTLNSSNLSSFSSCGFTVQGSISNGSLVGGNGMITITQSAINSLQIQNNGGDYWIFVVEILPLLTTTNTPCAGSALNLTSDFGGLTSGVSYNWTGPNGFASNLQNPIISNVAAANSGTYTVTASNGTVTAKQTQNVTVNPVPDVNPVNGQTLCHGALTNAILFSSNTAGVAYSWTNNNPSIGLAASGTGNIPAFTAVNYFNQPETAIVTVTPKFTANGTTCEGSPRNFAIIVNPSSKILSQPVSTRICANGNAVFSAITSNMSGYQWQVNTGSGFNNLQNTAPYSGVSTSTLTITSAAVTANGYQYRLITTGTCGSTIISDTVTLNVSGLSSNAIVDNVSCNGGSDGSITISPSGGIFPYTFNWGDGSNAEKITGLNAGTYKVTITDANLCSLTESFTITQPDALIASTTQSDVSCNGGSNGSATVNVTGGTGTYTYLWTPSGGTASEASGLTAGIYTVTATDTNSCTITKTITITEPDFLSANITVADVTCYNGNNGSAAATIAGGTAPYTYLWPHSGETTSSVENLKAGTYQVIITDNHSCTLSQSIEIKQPENPVNLNTAIAAAITVSGAILSGTASSNTINTDKGECLAEVGFVYAAHVNPTTADTKVNVISALGNFTSNVSTLRGNTTYYVRTYAINSSGFINYGNEVSFTTEKYILSIAASSGTKVYGTADPVFNYTVTGFVNGDTNAVINGKLSREAGENVGQYSITLGNINAGADYKIAYTEAEFEITKASQTINWNQTLEFGCDDSGTVTLTASTDSGLPVSYSIANTATGIISGSTLTLLNSGNTTITAVQDGDQNHNPAVIAVKPIEISRSGLVAQQWADVLFFDNKSNDFTAWQWYKDGNAVAGAIRQYYSENQALNGSYYVIAKNKNGNSVKSCPIQAIGTAFSKSLKIHPNPVTPSGEFNLECDFSQSQLNGSEITIFDITGKLVQTITNVKPHNQIIAPPQSAIYIVVLSLSNGQKKTINLLVK